MAEIAKGVDDLVYREPVEEEIVTRKNDFCIILKTPNENGWYDIQKNSAWSAIPSDEWAEVLDELVEGAFATGGYLIPTFSEDGTKMIDYKPTEIPKLPEPETQPTQLDIIEAQTMYTAMMTDTLLGV